MVRCKGITRNGNRCKATATSNNYCRWHMQNKCAVCYTKFKSGESALNCGHWVHRECVQKAADAMQELRNEEGYPPLEECVCPVCRSPVPDMKPAPRVEPILVDVVLDNEEMRNAYQMWETSSRTAPLNWYIWMELCNKYPDYENQEGLITAAHTFEQLIRTGVIDPRPPVRDQRFAEILDRPWR